VFVVLSTVSTPKDTAKSLKAGKIKVEENGSETDFSFDCNMAEGA
jgi:hypothetical protein